MQIQIKNSKDNLHTHTKQLSLICKITKDNTFSTVSDNLPLCPAFFMQTVSISYSSALISRLFLLGYPWHPDSGIDPPVFRGIYPGIIQFLQWQMGTYSLKFFPRILQAGQSILLSVPHSLYPLSCFFLL